MNDFEIDELASAYLDDAVTDEERARVDADPALRRRVDELRRVQDALRTSTVEPVPADARDASIATAVAASPVVDLGAERARRRVKVASIAAAAILLVGAVGLVLRSVSSDSSIKTSATAAGSSSASVAAEAPSGPTSSVATTRMLGAYPDRAALVAAVQTAAASSQATGAAGAANDKAAGPLAAESAPASRCAVTPPDNTASQILSDNAVLDGTAVQVDVFALSDGSRRLVVTSPGACTLVFSQTL